MNNNTNKNTSLEIIMEEFAANINELKPDSGEFISHLLSLLISVAIPEHFRTKAFNEFKNILGEYCTCPCDSCTKKRGVKQ